jgi:hypothetical protein
MNDSPYIFPELTATRGGIPDPLVEVDGWLSQLQDVLDAAPETADDAYDLLALWAKLRRVRPELIEQLSGMQLLAQIDAILATRGSLLASQALTIPNPRMWLMAVQSLDQAFEDVGLAETRSTLAEELLTDLDDATLVLDTARRHGIDDRELESELEPCLAWLGEHADLFLPAAVHVQAVGMAMRPELSEFDYGLAVTALKYVDVLCATRVAEEELALAHVPQLSLDEAKRIAARWKEEQQRISTARAAFVTIFAVKLRNRMRQAPLARAGDAMPFEPPYWCQWASPAGDLTARLTIPPQPAADERVMVEFLDAAQQRATGFAGQTATLHGVEAAIDSSGKATFLLSSLVESDQPLVLRVGSEQIEWRLIATNMEH